MIKHVLKLIMFCSQMSILGSVSHEGAAKFVGYEWDRYQYSLNIKVLLERFGK